jgi:hypothetical protein
MAVNGTVLSGGGNGEGKHGAGEVKGGGDDSLCHWTGGGAAWGR